MAREVRPLVFLGTPSAAAVVLERLLDEGFEVVHVVTRPDARRGRGGATSPSPVKKLALERGIEVSHDLDWFATDPGADVLGVVVAYGRIIPARVLEMCPMINVHFSLLPRWRGAAPVERAILAGDEVTGVCIMDLEETLDTGPVRARSEVEIRPDHTTATLTDDLALVGATTLIELLRNGLGTAVPQSGEVTYAHKIEPEEHRIDWSRSAIDVVRQVRALRAFTVVDGQRLRVIEASVDTGAMVAPPAVCDAGGLVGTGEGSVRLEMVQPEGKRAMAALDWLRGRSGGGVRFE